MERHGETPNGSLAAQVPVSTRLADDNDQTNKVATMAATLATDIDDPLERIRAIHASTQSAKELTEAVRKRRIQSVGEVAPPLLIGLASRAAWSLEHERPDAGGRERRRVERPRSAVPGLLVRREGLRDLRSQRAALLCRPQHHVDELHRPPRLRADLGSRPPRGPWDIADGIKRRSPSSWTPPASASPPSSRIPSIAEPNRSAIEGGHLDTGLGAPSGLAP